jgi:YVTN family beta-propeller protein
MRSLTILSLLIGAAACSMAQKPLPNSSVFGQHKKLPLRSVVDIPLSGKASRLDYQYLDAQSGRLYIARLGDDMLTVVDVRGQKVVGDVKDLKHIHGVIAVPELHRIYASATGTNELAVIDDQTLQVVARVPAGNYPDGIAYAAKEKKLYVSDLRGKTETVIDAVTNKVAATIPLNAPAGNTQYDAFSDRILVAVHNLNSIIEIDPTTDRIVGTYPLTGCRGAHGLLIDSKNRFAFAACEDNAKLAMFDLTAKKLLAVYDVGDEPDVLAFDAKLERLYVAAESGVLTIFDERGKTLETIGRDFYAEKAHTVAVDPVTGQVYFPLEDVNGNPVLRIAVPADKITQ